jgi:predicted glycosyltransferase/peptidoglycan/xylan/chitin deacetylase (PgdA/CDA1 family)
MRYFKFYYALKAVFPRSIQIRLRQMSVRRLQRHVGDVWPILESAGRAPEGWKGWPEGKQFALVLTHDVETARGVARVPEIMALEERYGVRSAFNLVPKRYVTPPELRQELVRRGFEVGIHGLYHDLSLFRSKKEFMRQAVEINRYLKDWGTGGFRCPYMIRNLVWMRDHLDIEYDSSTFDTDPFEPQPDGVGTIFPFIVDGARGDRQGYVELPCTLPQDLNLFVLLGESTIDIWRAKLDWIAAHGGMALFDTHPDYMQSGGECGADEYPLRHYEEFLDYVRTHYAGRYWQALPCEVTLFWRKRAASQTQTCQATEFPCSVTAPLAATVGCGRNAMGGGALSPPVSAKCGADEAAPSKRYDGRVHSKVIWIDMDNTPHVPFFKPIIAELKRRGYVVEVTARDAFQVCDLAVKMGVACRRIGRHYGKNRAMKVLGLFYRALQMLPFALRARPALAVSHGSRAQIILANFLGIHSVLIEDYEYAKFPPLMRPTWRIVPAIIPQDSVGAEQARVLTYPGIKEDVYVPQFVPDPRILAELGVAEAEILVTVRPPATEAHYHNPESEGLFAAVMARLHETPQVRTVLLPRNQKQGEEIKKRWPEYFSDGRVIIPQVALDGLNLIWHSDLVVSGGGTMNREAAALGVPVYSTFRGMIGAVDKHLQKEGRLTLLTSEADVGAKLQICKRERRNLASQEKAGTLNEIVAHIESLLSRMR